MLKWKLIVEHIFTGVFNKLKSHKNSNLLSSLSVCSRCSRWMTLRFFYSILKQITLKFKVRISMRITTEFRIQLVWFINNGLFEGRHSRCYIDFRFLSHGLLLFRKRLLRKWKQPFLEMTVYACVSNQIRHNKIKIMNKCWIFKGKRMPCLINDARSSPFLALDSVIWLSSCGVLSINGNLSEGNVQVIDRIDYYGVYEATRRLTQIARPTEKKADTTIMHSFWFIHVFQNVTIWRYFQWPSNSIILLLIAVIMLFSVIPFEHFSRILSAGDIVHSLSLSSWSLWSFTEVHV